MRYGVEYQLPGGSIGLTIFSAQDDQAARKFVEEMKTKYGHTSTFNLKPLPDCSIKELYCLFRAWQVSLQKDEVSKGDNSSYNK